MTATTYNRKHHALAERTQLAGLTVVTLIPPASRRYLYESYDAIARRVMAERAAKRDAGWSDCDRAAAKTFRPAPPQHINAAIRERAERERRAAIRARLLGRKS